jgi:hypothetical protein
MAVFACIGPGAAGLASALGEVPAAARLERRGFLATFKNFDLMSAHCDLTCVSPK